MRKNKARTEHVRKLQAVWRDFIRSGSGLAKNLRSSPEHVALSLSSVELSSQRSYEGKNERALSALQKVLVPSQEKVRSSWWPSMSLMTVSAFVYFQFESLKGDQTSFVQSPRSKIESRAEQERPKFIHSPVAIWAICKRTQRSLFSYECTSVPCPYFQRSLLPFWGKKRTRKSQERAREEIRRASNLTTQWTFKGKEDYEVEGRKEGRKGGRTRRRGSNRVPFSLFVHSSKIARSLRWSLLVEPECADFVYLPTNHLPRALWKPNLHCITMELDTHLSDHQHKPDIQGDHTAFCRLISEEGVLTPLNEDPDSLAISDTDVKIPRKTSLWSGRSLSSTFILKCLLIFALFAFGYVQAVAECMCKYHSSFSSLFGLWLPSSPSWFRLWFLDSQPLACEVKERRATWKQARSFGKKASSFTLPSADYSFENLRRLKDYTSSGASISGLFCVFPKESEKERKKRERRR